MASPTYRIGPSDFFTPSDLKADADTLNAQTDRLEAEVTGNESISGDFSDGYTAFLQRWKAFYEQHWGGLFSSWLSAVNDSNRDQLIAFENEFGAWAGRAASEGAAVDPVYQASTGSGDTLGKQIAAQTAGLPSLSTVAIVVVILLIAFFVLGKKAV